MLLITGCGKSKDQSNYTPSITVKDIYTGSEGLELEFFKGIPPGEVYENGFLQFAIKLHNKGAYNITDGYLALGIENEYLSDPSIIRSTYGVIKMQMRIKKVKK